MSRSSWLKEKDEKGSRNYCDEGSAARTRPFSIEEIMLRRMFLIVLNLKGATKKIKTLSLRWKNMFLRNQ